MNDDRTSLTKRVGASVRPLLDPDASAPQRVRSGLIATVAGAGVTVAGITTLQLLGDHPAVAHLLTSPEMAGAEIGGAAALGATAFWVGLWRAMSAGKIPESERRGHVVAFHAVSSVTGVAAGVLAVAAGAEDVGAHAPHTAGGLLTAATSFAGVAAGMHVWKRLLHTPKPKAAVSLGE